jgi:opacity protein-like surface antigen
MKRWVSLVVCLAFLLSFSPAYAQMNEPLGNGHAGIKVDKINFTAGDLKDLDAEDGVYLGLDAYWNVSPNIYIGGEIGWASPDGSRSESFLDPFFGPTPVTITLDSEITYIPIEVNAKYVTKLEDNLSVSLGGGISLNRLDADIKASLTGFPSLSDSDDDWLFGGQVFIDLNYKMNNFFVGLNGKYQLTQDSDLQFSNFGVDTDADASNWRIGGQIGWIF